MLGFGLYEAGPGEVTCYLLVCSMLKNLISRPIRLDDDGLFAPNRGSPFTVNYANLASGVYSRGSLNASSVALLILWKCPWFYFITFNNELYQRLQLLLSSVKQPAVNECRLAPETPICRQKASAPIQIKVDPRQDTQAVPAPPKHVQHTVKQHVAHFKRQSIQVNIREEQGNTARNACQKADAKICLSWEP